MLLAVDAGRLGPDLKWEPSRGGALFPHLYAPLDLAAVLWAEPLTLGADGTPRPARRSVRVSGLFGLGQSLLLALPPERAHDLAVKSLELGLYPRADRARRQAPRPASVRARLSQSGRHGGGFRQGCARAARAARHGLRLRRGRHADAARAKRQSAARACSARSADRAVINRLGFNNEGQEAALAPVARRRRQASSASISARDATAKTASAITCRASRAWRRWRAISPSISPRPTRRACAISRRRRRSMRCSRRVQEARAATRRKPPLLVKLAPDLADDDLPEVVRVILAHGVDGIVVSNTTLSREGLSDRAFAKEAGGLSGRPLFARATRMLARVYQLTRGQAAADRRRRHRFGRSGAGQDRGRRLSAPALYRAWCSKARR